MKRAEFRSWLRRHGYSLLSSIGSLVREPVASILTITVLAIALSLPLGLHTMLVNLDRIHAELDRLDSISVFLRPEVDSDQARRLASTLSARPEIVAADPVSPEQGLRELAGATGLDALEVGDVALPWLLQVIPAAGHDPGVLADSLRQLAAVDLVVVDLDWIRRLEAMLDVFRSLVRVLAALFGLSLLFVVANTIRNEVQRRREEIEVMALVGATDGYVRRPFLYAGLWLGVSGAALAWLLIAAGVMAMQGPVERLAASYGADAGLVGPSMDLLLPLLAASAALGVVGAWLAVSRALARIHP